MNDGYTIWVCIDCMLHYANGECGSCHDDHGHDCEPWALWALAQMGNVTMGMMHEAHECDMTREEVSQHGCDCETDVLSRFPCEGCGSHFHGERHAFTVWEA